MGPGGRFLDERLDPVVSTARLILEIVPGERRLLPEFGCRIHSLPSLSTPGERQLGAALVEEALDRWAPSLGIDRAEILSVEEGKVRMTLRAHGAWHELSLTHRTDARHGASQGKPQPEGPWRRRALDDRREARDP
jgi:phage baseplate assembly protein W